MTIQADMKIRSIAPWFEDRGVSLYHGDCREVLKHLATGSVQTAISSPPYFGLRDYLQDMQIGLEAEPHEYLQSMRAVFREMWRVLKDDGTVWLNIGDSYANDGKWGGQTGGKHRRALHAKTTPNGRNKKYTGFRPKELMGIPWMLAFALREDGWIIRQDIIWHKPSPMPESVTDRCTKAHEYIFLLVKQSNYYFDHEAILEECAASTMDRLSQDVESQVGSYRANGGEKTNGTMKAVGGKVNGGACFGKQRHDADGTGAQQRQYERPVYGKRNKRSVWTIPTVGYKGAHFATFPPKLIEPCILAGSRPGDVVLDPFSGTATVGEVSLKHGRQYIGIELNADYLELSKQRFRQHLLFGGDAGRTA